VEITRSVGPKLPRRKLEIPRGEVSLRYTATDSLAVFVYRFVIALPLIVLFGGRVYHFFSALPFIVSFLL